MPCCDRDCLRRGDAECLSAVGAAMVSVYGYPLHAKNGHRSADGLVALALQEWRGFHLEAVLYRLAAYAMLNLLDDAAMLAMMFC